MSCVIVLSSDEESSPPVLPYVAQAVIKEMKTPPEKNIDVISLSSDDEDGDLEKNLTPPVATSPIARIIQSREWIPVNYGNSKSPVCLVRPIIPDAQTSPAHAVDDESQRKRKTDSNTR